MKKYHNHSESFKNATIAFLFIFVFFSCGNSVIKKEFCNSEGQQVVQEWFNDNQIKSSIIYFDKSGENYVSVSYNIQGRMIDSAVYKNGHPEGVHKYFDANSGLTHIETYKNGMLTGISKAIYDNGVTSFQGYMKNNNKAGEWIFHYRDGRPITYEFYDSSGKIKYFKKYDDSGNTEKVTGSGIIDVVLNTEKTDANTLIKANVTVASPSGSKTGLSVSKDGTTIVNSYNLKKPVIQFVFPEDKKGEKIYNFILTMKDEKNGKTEEYSVKKTIIVK